MPHPTCRCGGLHLGCDAPEALAAAAVRVAAERATMDRVLPILRAQDAVAETMARLPGAPEKKGLKVGFIGITCATPIIVAAPMGFYARNGLDVEPDPFNQRAVCDGMGFIHLLTRELWDGHPCCALAVPRRMATEAPNTCQALLRLVIEATAHASKAENREEIAGVIAGQNYLNQPVTVVEQALTGTYADGLGSVKRQPDRVSFEPFPYQSTVLWIMTQMKRWGQVRGDIRWRDVAEQVCLATDAGAKMRDLGLLRPESATGRTASWAGPSTRPIPTATFPASRLGGPDGAARPLRPAAAGDPRGRPGRLVSRRDAHRAHRPGARPRVRQAARHRGAGGQQTPMPRPSDIAERA